MKDLNPYQIFQQSVDPQYLKALYPTGFYPSDFTDIESWLQLCETCAAYYDSVQIGSVNIQRAVCENQELTKYLGGSYSPRLFSTVTFEINGKLTMSLTPLELQSHINPIHWANGKVLIAGLGLGYYLNQIKDKPSVNSILVIEQNPDVIEAYFTQFPQHPKVEIREGDIFDFPAEFTRIPLISSMPISGRILNFKGLLSKCFSF